MRYDFEDIEHLQLSCHAEGSKLYEIEWYKLKLKTWKKLKLNTIIINDTNYKIAQPKKMEDIYVTYKCEIRRKLVSYRSYEILNITLIKGNLI